ncbi:hypothetical protein [Sphaerisporangium aureirubrum]|uniref:Uncharacterized protein n=1 Tax=Sphaerisporangium aureirubrum TaxID=1544736 RepID=A0ABW1NUM6_9ACTN
MPISRHDLHDLLDERSRPAFDRPIPWESLRLRASGARRRRYLSVAVACAVAATAVGGVAVSRSAMRGPDRGPQVAATVVDGIPARFQEADGTVYRRLADARLDAPRETTVTFDVAVRDRPLAFVVDCPASSAYTVLSIVVTVPGSPRRFSLKPSHLVPSCERDQPVDVPRLPAGTRTATFTVETGKKIKGSGPPAGTWRFGVYEWTPAGAMRPAAPPEDPPKAITEFRLVDHRTAVWPAADEVTLTVPAKGGQLAITAFCGGDIAGRAEMEIRVNGRLLGNNSPCPAPPGENGLVYDVLGKEQTTGRDKVTIQICLVPEIPQYRYRPGTLTAAVYRKP